MSAKDILEMASNAAVGFSALVVAALAILGLNAWKKRTKFEVARKMLGLAKKYCSDVQQSRDPWGFKAESDDRPRQQHETREQAAALDERYARMKRLQPSAETLNDLLQASWEAEAVLKRDLAEYTRPFIAVHNKIVVAIEQHYAHDEGAELSLDEYKEMMTTIYGPPNPDDSVSRALQDAIEKLRKQLKRYV